ncbi:P-loop containing nucleoside triphosphate hydrolase protein, partial [Cadophora sp. DSE1049]
GERDLVQALVQNYGYRHVSVGDLLRGLVDGESKPNIDVKGHVQQGTLVPTAVLLNILQPAVMPETLGSILVDGFPRRLNQGIASEDQASSRSGKPDLVLFFDCNETVARERYLTRKLEGRLSDNERFQRRYDEFTRLNHAVLEYYGRPGVLVTSDGPTQLTGEGMPHDG